MTSNIGSDKIKNPNGLGFSRKDDATSFEHLKTKLRNAVDEEFRPEFINRLDEIVFFKPLTKDDIFHIVGLEVDLVAKRAKEKSIGIVLSAEAREFLFDKGYDPAFGARPMRRAVERHVENPLSEALLKGEISAGDEVELGVNEDKSKIAFRIAGKHKSEPKERRPRKKTEVPKEAEKMDPNKE
jgi:ATP-dependent Clp protease ATP-binding subunit ClpC